MVHVYAPWERVLAMVPVVVIVLALAINRWRHRDDPD